MKHIEEGVWLYVSDLFNKVLFETLQLHQLYCNILSNNKESLDLFKKMGFTESGIKKDWVLTSSGYIDELMLQLISEEQE